MIQSVEVKNLRGIRSGKVEGLSRLVVLVGPNGSGKSTLLEGMLIGASSFPPEAVGLAVRHRLRTTDGARWLLWKGGMADPATVRVHWQGDPQDLDIEREIRWDSALRLSPNIIKEFTDRGAPAPYSVFQVHRMVPGFKGAPAKPVYSSRVAVAADNTYLSYENETDPPLRFISFVESGWGGSFHDLFSEAVKRGARPSIIALAKRVIPGLQEIEILTEDSTPRLFLTFGDRAVPATLAGDGTAALLRTSFELASAGKGTVLLEEPEVHMHPSLLKEVASVMIAAARQGTQVVATTHSLELIENLLAGLDDTEIGDPNFMTIVRTRLIDGELLTTTLGAKDAERARVELSEDLR